MAPRRDAATNHTPSLDTKLSITIDHHRRTISQGCRHNSICCRNNIRMNHRIIKPQSLPLFFGRWRNITTITFFVGRSNRHMRIPKWTTNIFVIEGLTHHTGNPTCPAVSQTIFAKFVSMLDSYHLTKQRFTLLCTRLHHHTILKTEKNPFDHWSIPPQRLIETNPSLSPTSIWRNK